MPKRKRSKSKDLDALLHKLKKLEKRIKRRRFSDSSEEHVSSLQSVSTQQAICSSGSDMDDQIQWLEETLIPNHEQTPIQETPIPETPIQEPIPNQEPVHEKSSTPVAEQEDLHIDILKILGEDPTVNSKKGQNLRSELACRLQYIATEGLEKENRNGLINKYPMPENCPHINAPKLNLEIKAAIPETISKRDKGIETKQKQMASAIACLAEVISTQLSASNKDADMLQKLMDAVRLLCDIQHGDSITRRNFILFALKKDMKEHLSTTKVDSFLFGESLIETLKSAKAVNRSGVELKGEKPTTSKAKTKPLNRKAPAPPRRQSGTLPRSRGPAVQRATAPPPPPQPVHSSKTWPQAPQHPPRRRY